MYAIDAETMEDYDRSLERREKRWENAATEQKNVPKRNRQI